MRQSSSILPAAALLLAFGPAPGVAEDLGPIDPQRDYHSFANVDEVVMTHVYLHLDADFVAKQLKGYVELDLKRINPAATTLVLDTKALDIAAVALVTPAGLAPAKWEMGVADATLGTPLSIEIGTQATKVRITYATTDGSDGLNWADPAQTNDKKHPFMYSLSQSIYGRTWFPQQDTPLIRVTYAADITTPKDLLALMSADNDPNAVRDGSYHFEMPQTVVPYLIAIAVGDLHFEAISARAGVYAEAGMLEKAAWEFADSEKMIQAVEGLYGPYQWGRYDLLIMPPSFPFGGMEHARLSFITPTVITGDRGLVDLISHELSHSWSGNYVTNGTWRDLWLNEGITSYVENRVIEALYGKDRADMDLVVNYEDGLAAIKDLPTEKQLLAIDLRGQHPDAVFSDIPYTKGMLFFKFLEERVGRAAFDAFLKQYFEDFAWGTITTDVFETYLQDGLMTAHPAAFTVAEITEWIHQPGYPAFGPVPEADGYALADQTLAKLASGGLAPSDVDTSGWMIQQQLRLIKGLPLDMEPAKLAELDTSLGLSTTGNLKLAYEWLLYAAKVGYAPALDARFEQLMTEQGRIAFTKDLYEAVLAIDPDRAKAVYAKAKPGYHPITVWEVDQVFK